MQTYDKYMSELQITPRMSSAEIEARKGEQWRNVGVKLADILRETPNVFARLSIEEDGKTPTERVQRLSLDLIRLDYQDADGIKGLLAIINRQQRTIAEYEQRLGLSK